MNILKVKNLYYLGPEGTYSGLAMRNFVKKYNIIAENIIPMSPITAIIRAVDCDKNSIAVLPIENSIEGIVRETIDNLIKIKDESVKISAETIIPISHCLMSSASDISDVKHILSHPQALGQCSGYICENLKNCDVTETFSTSAAAKLAKEKGSEFAAIASRNAAEIFNLNILAEQINDEKDNETRFILLSRHIPDATGMDKTNLFFAVKNEPGSLVKVLNVFHKHNINLIYIESRPSKKKMGEYNFCVDLEGHISDENISSAIEDIKGITNKIIFTGSYARFNK